MQFVLGIGLAESSDVKGLVLTRTKITKVVTENAPFQPSYPHHIFTVYNAFCARNALKTAPITTLDILNRLQNCRAQELRKKLPHIPTNVTELVLSFIDIGNDGDFSEALCEWLFLECVLVVPNSETVQREVQNAALEYKNLVKGRKSRWPFFFGMEKGKQMWWSGSKVFKTTHYPPSLKALYHTLCDVFPSLACLTPDCLPTWYRTGKTELDYHQDKFGEKHFGQRELVILLFAGAPRDLAIKCGNFLRTVHCSPQNTVILTPCANDIFFHAKKPTDSRKHSLTFAFRRGISPQ